MRDVWIVEGLVDHEAGGRVTLASLGEADMYSKQLGTSTDFRELTGQLQRVSMKDHPVLNPGNSVPKATRFFEPVRAFGKNGDEAFVWPAEYRHAAAPGNFFNEVTDGHGFVVTRDPAAKSDHRPLYIQSQARYPEGRNVREEDVVFGMLVAELIALRQTSHIVHAIERADRGPIGAA